MDTFDYVIIGAGSAGFAAAIRADELGARTALINGGLPLGGTCVNVGCVPSKTLLHIAELHHRTTRRPQPGLRLEARLDFSEAVAHELRLVAQMRQDKYADVLTGLGHVTLFDGEARFVGDHAVQVADQTLRGERFLICTGSTAVAPPIAGLGDVAYLTHVEALRLQDLPPRLLVIGGGPIALEFAQMYRHFGSQVTLLQRSLVLREAEPEVSRRLVQVFREEGIAVHEGVRFLGAQQRGGAVRVQAELADGSAQEFVGDALLVGTGKRANTAGLNLEAAGVRTEATGIPVDRQMRTSAAHVWAAGDVVAAPKRLETTAAKEGHIAAENALMGAALEMTYHDAPSVIFTTPAVASVGPTDAEANRQGVACRCVAIPFALVPKARIIGDTRGVIKMVIERETRRILGVHILAREAQEIVHEATLAVRFGLTIDDIRQTVHVFPTLSESIKLVAQAFDRDVARLACCIE